ncbi:Bug family tripartite tricarboxylate transporter substrate binding protein [Variovorax terrae]|uniref:Tripartite tricarboxylate transporter substrate binding protein n=1 Tax=Variovorax terrae TaxID=2923278 RepID=A0A9X1VVF9_9BURK|nr:tripartite tricarboxylate transporter substrate binding protein [Variovorax terrae]MCJ0764005.1 tripartite tricarboxylate transporter substrate binding protein [Variovorax terrae]
MNRRKLFKLMPGAAAVLATGPAAWAQAADYPSKPVKVVVGVNAGGAADYFARIFAQKMTQATGQSFFVDNRPGAGGTLAADYVAKSAADGYTLLITAPTVMIVAPYLYKQLNFVPERDFAPIALLAGGPVVLVVNAQVPARSVAELIALAKQKPGELSFGSGGQGTNSHLSGELFASMTGTRLTHVPYKGDGQALTDLLGGQVQMMFTGYNLVEPHVKSGKLRLLGVTGDTRLAPLPDVPTVAEAGVKGFHSTGWIGLYAPRHAPAQAIQRLNAEWQKARRQPDVHAKFEAMGMGALSSDTPGQFAAFQKSEAARWSKIILDAGVKPE